MNILSKDEYKELIKDAKLMKSDGFGPKVYRRPDATYVKLFRQKRKFSLATIWPYVKRFLRNSTQLKKRGIDTVNVLALYNCPDIERTIVTYSELKGELFRDVLTNEHSNERIFQLAHFIAELHQKGIYFRSIHLENIVLQPNGHLGLIDIADMRIRYFSLNPLRRVRNLCHMLKYQEDNNLLSVNGRLDSFLNNYLENAQLGYINKYFFTLFTRKYIEPTFTPTI